jgi:hypothetical protein
VAQLHSSVATILGHSSLVALKKGHEHVEFAGSVWALRFRLIVFTVYEHRNICIARPNGRAGFTTNTDIFISLVSRTRFFSENSNRP